MHKISTNGATPARPTEPTPVAGIRAEPFPPPATRRRQSSFRDQTFRDQRAALPTSTSLQASPSKRYEKHADSSYKSVQLTISDSLTTASQVHKHRNGHLHPAPRKSYILGRPHLANPPDSASLLPSQSVDETSLMSRNLSISSLLLILMIFTLALDPVNPISIHFQSQVVV